MATREQEFSETRRLLDWPEEQDPSPDLIVAGGIRQEQFMMNEAGNFTAGWTVSPTPAQITSIADQAEYMLWLDDPDNTQLLSGFGRALFVYRELSGNAIVPVAFTDYGSEIANQSYDPVSVPGGVVPSIFGEKIAFFRSATDGATNARIYPVPDEARVYKIAYAQGAIDPSTFAWNDTPFLPEWSHLRSIRNALSLLSGSEWSGNTPEQNRMKRQDVKEGLVFQLQQQEPEYRAFLVNPQREPTIGTVGAWYDD